MITFRRVLFLIFYAAVAALIVACAVPQPQTTNTNSQTTNANLRRERLNKLQQLTIYYDNTSGKAGFHMVAQARANCPVTWYSDKPSIVEGYLPPGLKLDNWNIVGTPQQPGNWLVKVRFTTITCQGTSYPNQDVNVFFNIQGDAPREL